MGSKRKVSEAGIIKVPEGIYFAISKDTKKILQKLLPKYYKY